MSLNCITYLKQEKFQKEAVSSRFIISIQAIVQITAIGKPYIAMSTMYARWRRGLMFCYRLDDVNYSDKLMPIGMVM